MTDKIAVVETTSAIVEAYQMGHDRYQDAEVDGVECFEPVKDSARWANTTAPTLRLMAGYGDGGHGTHQVQRRVAAIRKGAEDDEPAAADLVESARLYETLVEAFDMGAYDAVEDTYDPDAAVALW